MKPVMRAKTQFEKEFKIRREKYFRKKMVGEGRLLPAEKSKGNKKMQKQALY